MIIFTCDLEKANTEMPRIFVIVIPEKTLAPNFVIASLVRSSFFPLALQYARTMCDTNSTPNPTH